MIQVLLFAGLQEIAGKSVITINLEDIPLSIREVKATLSELFPAMSELLTKCMTAVNQEYASDETIVTRKDEIAFIPPVSGG